jgi:predicted small lipoprotein YifL
MRLRAAAALLVVLVAAAGITGCGRGPLFAPPSTRNPKPCTIRIEAPDSAIAILVHRDSASSWAELKAVLLTAQPNEHILLFKAATGRLVGSFITPPGPALPGPTPPPPLNRDPTQVQTYTYGQEASSYERALRRERTRLHLRWIARLATWVRNVMSEAAAPPWARKGPNLDSEVPGLIRGLTAAGASITSLNNISGIQLGSRIVVAILDLDKVPTTTPPPLPGGLQGATIVVAGFTGNSSQEATWRADWVHDGARRVVLLTPSTDDELSAVDASALNQDGHHRRDIC